jgi:putative SOS response-associated peptidase YedK
MCNEHALRAPFSEIARLFGQAGLPLAAPEGVPNLEPRERIRITETGPMARAGAGGAELVVRPRSWRGPTGAPVFNFRSDGRRFPLAARCAIPTDGFYEFTAAAEPKVKRKDRWRFTLAGEGTFFIAGVMREEAWAMLTTGPGPDMAPFHNRQVVVLRPAEAAAWLRGAPEPELLRPAPAGTLVAERVELPDAPTGPLL